MFSPHLVTEEDFTIAGNHFERNKAGGGGGTALGAVFQQTGRVESLNKSVLKKSVNFRRNTFVQNRASSHGGAMVLGPGWWAVSYNKYAVP